MRSSLSFFLVIVLAAAAVAAACGGDDESPDDQAAAQQESAEGGDGADPGDGADAGDDEPQAQQEQGDEQAAPIDSNAEAQADDEQEQAAAQEQQAEPEQEEPADDPDRELLVYGETFSGSVEGAEEVRQFRFEGDEGDFVRITVDGKDGMDPVVTLLEPNRTEIIINDDVSTANRDSLIVQQLPTGGLQVVRVEAFDANSDGRFEITIERLPDSIDNEDEAIQIGESRLGILGTPTDVDLFEFAGDQGQAVIINVDGDLGVDVFAQLVDPGGSILLANDDSGHSLDAELRVILPASGIYRVEVSAAGARLKIGGYEISILEVAETTPPTEAVAAEIEGVALTYLAALQEGDTLTLIGLAGPEALALWGWETADDVARDITKLQSIGLIGTALESTTEIDRFDADRARVLVTLDEPGSDTDPQIRFDLSRVSGQWKADFWERVFVPAA